jgi:ferredoxin-NADP reductase
LQLGNAATSTGVYICGPEAFMTAIADSAMGLGVPSQQIYMESFNF